MSAPNFTYVIRYSKLTAPAYEETYSYKTEEKLSPNEIWRVAFEWSDEKKVKVHSIEQVEHIRTIVPIVPFEEFTKQDLMVHTTEKYINSKPEVKRLFLELIESGKVKIRKNSNGKIVLTLEHAKQIGLM